MGTKRGRGSESIEEDLAIVEVKYFSLLREHS